jgi:nucleotide-binding universal stress UspA family protein
MKTIEKILVYVDGTEETITAVQYAVCLARETGAQLDAVYVVNTRALDDLVRTRIFLQTEEEEYRQDLEADAERYLNHVKKLASEKMVNIQVHKFSGNVHTEIKKMVREQGFDLLVLGEISQAKSRRDEFYNETERALRSVPCSVIVVKDPDRVWKLFEEA